MQKKINVLIAEDRLPLLARYTKILSSDKIINVCSGVTTGAEAVRNAVEYNPDIILMDIEMETQTAGLDATKRILEVLPDTKIIILTVFDDEDSVFTAFESGTFDYILKGAAPEDIIKAVKNAYSGLSAIRPEIAVKLRNGLMRMKQNRNFFIQGMHLIAQLTPAETEILKLAGKNYTRQQICELRHVELSTLKTEIHTILKKSNCTSVAELVGTLKELDIYTEFFS